MANEIREVALSPQDLREVATYAAGCAQEVLQLFEEACPTDACPREAIQAAWTFARGGPRGKVLRDAGWAAHKAAREAATPVAGEAARATMSAAAAAYLHPLADAHQVKHILRAAAHAARAAELAAGGDRAAGMEFLERMRQKAAPALVEVLGRYPAAPAGGGRVGELLRELDSMLRGP